MATSHKVIGVDLSCVQPVLGLVYSKIVGAGTHHYCKRDEENSSTCYVTLLN